MKNTSWSLFTYPVMDIKAAEALLNRRAAEGWALDRVYLGAFARFVPADTRWAWCVDWSRPGYSERPDYLALCADAGWVLVQKVGAFNLYKAPIGTPPIQTDGEEEAHRFRREVLRATCKDWIFLLAMILLLAALVLLVSDGSWRQVLLSLLLTQTGFFCCSPFLPSWVPGCSGPAVSCCGCGSGTGRLAERSPSPAGGAPGRQPGCAFSAGSGA